MPLNKSMRQQFSSKSRGVPVDLHPWLDPGWWWSPICPMQFWLISIRFAGERAEKKTWTFAVYSIRCVCKACTFPGLFVMARGSTSRLLFYHRLRSFAAFGAAASERSSAKQLWRSMSASHLQLGCDCANEPANPWWSDLRRMAR
jgi:hypothetical protein